MKRPGRRFLHIAAVIILLAAGGLGMQALSTRMPVHKKRRPPAVIPVVRTITVTVGPQQVVVRGEGTVRPLREIRLAPEVGGRVVYIAPGLINGGRFSKDEILLRIDPADYELAVTLARARVKDAESKLQLAVEETAASKEEWRVYHAEEDDPDGTPPPLVAREPQLAAARANLAAEKANLKKALLNLARTELKAPFNGRVSEKNVDIGEYVKSAQALATLYSTDAAEIVIPLDDQDLFWFNVPGFTPGDAPGSRASVSADVAGFSRVWSGRVVRTQGKIDERTRMVDVVIRVEDPYASRPPLPAGLFVTVDVAGRTIRDAAFLPRAALHGENVVWVVGKDGRLHFRGVDVARSEGERVLIRSGLADGEVLVVTPMKFVSDGIQVRPVAADKGADS